MQELLDLFPFASDDAEARKAIWSIISKLSVQIEETDMSPSTLHQLLSVLVSKSELIEEELFDHELDDSNGNHESSNGHTELNPIIIAVSFFFVFIIDKVVKYSIGARDLIYELADMANAISLLLL